MNEFVQESLWRECVADVRMYTARGNGSKAALIGAVLFARGVHLLFAYRLQRRLLRLPLVGKTLARIVWYVASCLYGCEISYHAKLAGGIYIPHAVGIVIGQSAVVERGVSIFQQVTLGVKKQGEVSFQHIKHNCYLGAGAKIIGNLTIGPNATIGVNSVVLTDVPAGATAAGVPAKIISPK